MRCRQWKGAATLRRCARCSARSCARACEEWSVGGWSGNGRKPAAAVCVQRSGCGCMRTGQRQDRGFCTGIAYKFSISLILLGQGKGMN
eukprot:364617-Chlamydomonas_euryale.AAC.5